MKKFFGIFIALFLGIVIAFGVAGCNVGAQNELQSTIDDLQSQIEEMEEQISERDATIEDLSELIDKLEEMQDRLAEMEEQISDRDATIADLKELINQLEKLELQIRDRDATIENLNERIKNLKEKIEQLEKELAEKFLEDIESVCTFYTLQEAYDYGYLTKTDLEAVAEESKSYSLDVPYLAIQQAIIKDYLYMLKESSQKYLNATVDDIAFWRYFGAYHGCMIVQLSAPYTSYPDVINKCIVEGIEIEYSGPSILVWKYK